MRIIKAKDFILRPITYSDVHGYFESRTDVLARKGFMYVPKNLAETRKFIKKIIAEMRKSKPNKELFVIEIDKQFAGFVGLHDLHQKYFEFKGKINYGSHPKFRGKGITTKAVKIITDYAFKKYKLKRIEGWCRTNNKASARVLEKAGYKFEGILRKNKYKDGKYFDDMLWAKVK